MHTFQVDYATTDKFLEEMGWEVLPYSPNLVHGDSHPFKPLEAVNEA
jgi:hypothetical protein